MGKTLEEEISKCPHWQKELDKLHRMVKQLELNFTLANIFLCIYLHHHLQLSLVEHCTHDKKKPLMSRNQNSATWYAGGDYELEFFGTGYFLHGCAGVCFKRGNLTVVEGERSYVSPKQLISAIEYVDKHKEQNERLKRVYIWTGLDRPELELELGPKPKPEPKSGPSQMDDENFAVFDEFCSDELQMDQLCENLRQIFDNDEEEEVWRKQAILIHKQKKNLVLSLLKVIWSL